MTIHNNIFHINKCLTIKLHNYENEHKASASLMLVVSSCNDSDIIVENANSGISIDKSRQLNLTPDEKLHKEQSSLENMLMDQIIYRDSAYILNMSKEEAIDLTIPDSLYVHYLKIVDDLNTLQ